MNPSSIQSLEHGIHVIDTGFVRELFDASHLVVSNGRGAFVDTGTNNSVPNLLSALDALRIDRADIDYVIVTHVHLDHAGGAGLLMQELPNAKLVIHPRGARHMADPSALMEGVRAVYGREIADRDYGELQPVAEQRIVTTSDGMRLDLHGRELLFAETPGHALHHHCIWDEASRGWFTGDTFGLCYPALATARGPHVVPATAPVQFDPQALHASIERLLSFDPQVLYLTHYGAVREPARIARQLLAQIDAMVAASLELAEEPDRHARLRQAFRDIYVNELRSDGSTLDEATMDALLATDVELNAQGAGVWLDRRKKQAGQTASRT